MREFRSAMSETDHLLSRPAHLPAGRWRAAVTGALLLRARAAAVAGGTEYTWSAEQHRVRAEQTEHEHRDVHGEVCISAAGRFLCQRQPACRSAAFPAGVLEGKGYLLLQLKPEDEMQK